MAKKKNNNLTTVGAYKQSQGTITTVGDWKAGAAEREAQKKERIRQAELDRSRKWTNFWQETAANEQSMRGDGSAPSTYIAKMMSDSHSSVDEENARRERVKNLLTDLRNKRQEKESHSTFGNWKASQKTPEVNNDPKLVDGKKTTELEEQLLQRGITPKGYTGGTAKQETKERPTTVGDYNTYLNEKYKMRDEGRFDNDGDPFWMSNEGLETNKRRTQSQLDEIEEQAQELKERKWQQENWYPDNAMQDWEDLYGSMKDGTYSQGENMLAYLNDDNNISDRAKEYYDVFRNSTEFEDTEVGRQYARERAFNYVFGYNDENSGMYDLFTEGMTPEEKADLDDKLDGIIEGMVNPFQDFNYDQESNALEEQRKQLEKELGRWNKELENRDTLSVMMANAPDPEEYADPVRKQLTPGNNVMQYIVNAAAGPQGDDMDRAYWEIIDQQSKWNNMTTEEKLDMVSKLTGNKSHNGLAESLQDTTEAFGQYYAFMTPEEVTAFQGYYEADDKEGARAFLEALKPYLSAYANEYSKYAAQEASTGKYGGVYGAMTVPFAPLNAAVGLAGTAAAMLGDEEAGDDNSTWYRGQNILNTIRAGRKEAWGESAKKLLGAWAEKPAEFLNGIFYSMADMYMATGIGGALSTSSEISQPLVQFIMSSEAASSTMTEQLERGIEPTEAALYAIGSGLIEAITEKYSIEQLLNPNVKEMMGDLKQMAIFRLKNFGTESAEEFASSVLNVGLDALLSAVNGHENELEEKYNQLKHQIGEKKALQTVLMDKLKEIGLEALAGGVSGYLMASAREIATVVDAKSTGVQIRNTNTSGNTGTDAIIDAALELSSETQSRKLAEELAAKREAEEEISDIELGRLAQNIQVETNETIARTASDVIEDRAFDKLEESGKDVGWRRSIAKIISKAVTSGGVDSLTKEEKNMLINSADAFNVYKDFIMFSDASKRSKTANDTISDIKEATKAETQARDSVSEVLSQKGSSPVVNADVGEQLATEEDIKNAKGERVQGNEAIYEGQYAKIVGAKIQTEITDADEFATETQEQPATEKAQAEEMPEAEGPSAGEQAPEIQTGITEADEIATETQERATTEKAPAEETQAEEPAAEEPAAEPAAKGPVNKQIPRLKFVIEINGVQKTVDASEIKVTDFGTAAIVRQAAAHPGYYSPEYVNTLLKAQANGKVKNVGTFLGDAIRLRLAGYTGQDMPVTGIDRITSIEIYNQGIKEHAQNRKAQVSGKGAASKVMMDGAIYGTKEWTEKLNKITDPHAKAQVETIAEFFAPTGIAVTFKTAEQMAEDYKNLTGQEAEGTMLYGEESANGISINVEGLDYVRGKGGKAAVKGAHNMVVTFGHEMTHYLQRHSMAGYNSLESYVFGQLAKNGMNVSRRVMEVMAEQGLDIEGAMSEIVADSCDQILASAEVRNHIEQTNKTLFGEIKSFVSNLIERVKTAISNMKESQSYDSRVMMRSANELAKIWLGAYDEAISGAIRYAEGSGNENGPKFSRATLDIGIEKGMTDLERYDVLKGRNITTQNAYGLLDEEELNTYKNLSKSKALTEFKKLTDRFGITGKQLSNKYIKGIDAVFSNRSLQESINHQEKEGYINLAALMPVFEKTYRNAIPVLIQEDRYQGILYDEKRIEGFTELLGAFRYGNELIPVKFDLKEYEDNNEQKLYVVATIKRDAITSADPQLGEPADQASSNNSIEEVIKNVNKEDEDLLLIIPAQFLNAEQLDGKRKALKNEGEYINWKANQRKNKPVNNNVNLTTERIDRAIAKFGAEDSVYKAYMAYINPQTFVKLNAINPELIENENRPLNGPELIKELETPYIIVDFKNGQVVGHQGRHRLDAMAKAGVENAALLVIPDYMTGDSKLTTIDSMEVKGKNKTTATINNLIPVDQNHRQELIDTYSESNNWFRYSKAQLDNEYMKAVENGDVQRQQELVDEAAEAAMPYSVIRKEDGTLRKLYHGTYSDTFTVFDKDLIGTVREGDTGFFGRGFYFTFHKGEARSYGNNVMEVFVDIRNPFDFRKELNTYNGERANIYGANHAVFAVNWARKFPELNFEEVGVTTKDGERKAISLQQFADEFEDVYKNKEFEVREVKSDEGNYWEALADPRTESYTNEDGKTFTWTEYGFRQKFYTEQDARNKTQQTYLYLANTVYDHISIPSSPAIVMSSNLTDVLKERGYDGVIQSEEGDEVVAFESNQIKLADPVTYDDKGKVIPLSERFDSSKNDIRWSRATAESMDVAEWMSNAKPWNLQTEDERQLLDKYKGLRTRRGLLTKTVVELNSDIRRKEGIIEKLTPEELQDLEKAKEKLAEKKQQLAETEDELFRVTSSEGYAGMMYRNNIVLNDFILGKTQNDVRESVEQMVDQVKNMDRLIDRQVKALRKLADSQAVKAVSSMIDKKSLNYAVNSLKSETNTAMGKKELESRLIEMALRKASGEDITEDARALAVDMTNRMRGYQMDVLERMRGVTITIGPDERAEMKGNGMTLASVREALKGTGVRVQYGDFSSLDTDTQEGGDLRTLLPELPQEISENSADALNVFIKWAQSMRDADQAAKQEMVDVEDTTMTVLALASTIKIRESSEFKKQNQLAAQTNQLADELAQAKQTMNDSTELAGRRAVGMASILQRDVQEAIKYYNTIARVAAQEEKQKVRTNIIEELKSENTKKLIQQQMKYEEMMKNDRKARELAEDNKQIRNRISTVASRVRKRLMEETDIKNIPEEAKPLARMMLKMLVQHDYIGYRHVLNANKQIREQTMKALDAWDKRDGEFKDEDLDWLIVGSGDTADYDLHDRIMLDLMNIEQGLLEYRNAEGQKNISLMDRKAALQKIDNAVREIWGVIAAREEANLNGKKMLISELAMQARDDMAGSRFKGEWTGKIGHGIGAVKSGVVYGNMTPEYFFKNLRNGTISQLYDEYHRAENRNGLEVGRAKNALARIAEDTGYGTWDQEKRYTFQLEKGGTVSLTLGEMMSLYATWQREAMNQLEQNGPEKSFHLTVGGFYTAQEEQHKIVGREKFNQKAHRLTEEDMAKIMNAMTPEQIEYVNRVVEYITKDIGALGNEASMRMYGIKKYNEQWYFPFEIWSGVKSQKSDQGAAGRDENRAAHASFTKRRRANANNALVIRDFTQTAVKHIGQMINYNTFAPAIEFMNRVMNYQMTEEGEGEDSNTKRNLRTIFGEIYGKDAVSYLDNFNKDVNGGVVRAERTVYDKLLSTFKKSAVAGSLSVAFQQPLSYIRASMMISPKYLAEAMNPEYWKGSRAEMEKYSGVAVIKRMGKFDMNFGQSAQDYIMPEKLTKTGQKVYNKVSDAATALPGAMDTMTWTRMWTACKLEQQAKNPGMDVNSREFLEKVAERFNDVMRKTQVYDSMLVKSRNMRSQNPFMKSLTSFMAEPTLTANVLADAVGEALAKDKGGMQKVAKAGATFVLSAIAQALVKGLFSTGRSPDDKKTWKENMAYRFGYNFMNEVNPMSMIPGYSDLIELLKNGELQDDAMSVVGKIMSSVKTTIKIASGQSTNAWRDIEDSVGQLAQLFTNVPLKNLMRDARAMYNFMSNPYAKRETSGAVLKYQFNDQFMTADNLLGVINTWLGEKGYKTTNDAYYGRIYEADKKGEKQTVSEMIEYLKLARNTKDSTINTKLKDLTKTDDQLTVEQKIAKLREQGMKDSNIASWITDQYKKGKITKQEAQKYYQMANKDKDANDAYFQFERVDLENSGVELESSGDYFRLDAAIEKDNATEITAAIRELNTHGYDESTINDHLKSKITSKYKAGEITKSQVESMLKKYRKDMSGDDIFWTLDRIDYTKETGNKLSSTDKSYRLDAAIEKNSAEAIRQAAAQMKAHGVTDDSISIHISQEWKPKYLAATGNEKIRMKDALTKALKAAGLTEEKAINRINNWKKK